MELCTKLFAAFNYSSFSSSLSFSSASCCFALKAHNGHGLGVFNGPLGNKTPSSIYKSVSPLSLSILRII